MGKTFFAIFLAFILTLTFCKDKNANDLQKISNNIWEKSNVSSTKDSVLAISLHKTTKNFILYWIKLKKKPYSVGVDLERSIEMVDNKTIFFNKFTKESNDYKYLLRKGIINLTRSTGIDDSLDGYMYIFQPGNNTKFKLIPLVDYFEILHSKRMLKGLKNIEGEEMTFDEVADYFWEK